MQLLLLLLLVPLALCVPEGFIDEGIADIEAISGVFCPNPRKNGKPMLILSAKKGKINVLEAPDDSDDFTEIADLGDRLCTDGERGLQSVRPHPNFEENRFIYMYFMQHKDGCRESTTNGPQNRLSRFTMDPDTLEIEMDSELVLFQTSPAPRFNHNGGSVSFGNDGNLWVTIGDGGSRNGNLPVSQDRSTLWGSVLRITDDGSIPNDNPFATVGVRCNENGKASSRDEICAEIYATGLRNPFRLTMNPNRKDKVEFHVGDVGAKTWEEISIGGTDYGGVNYGWPRREGPCLLNSNHNCPSSDQFFEPFYYYEHTQKTSGGAVVGSAFVPDEARWPSNYKYLFIDFTFDRIFNLIEDEDGECRGCTPPIPGFRNETFHRHEKMVDMFFGPFKKTQAIYYVARSPGQNIGRIRYTGSNNRAPNAEIDVDPTKVLVGETVLFDGSQSSDPDDDDLSFLWEFGDGSTSTQTRPEHVFDDNGEFTVTLTVTDEQDQTNQAFVLMTVGKRPTAEMILPAEGDEFFVGQALRLLGSAKDSQGVDLDEKQLFWEVRQHHADHFHPFLDRRAGNDFDLSAAPEPEDFHAATNSYLEVIMYAVDQEGLTTTISRRVNPKIVMVHVDSDPQGQLILLDEFQVTTPDTITSWENHNLRLDVKDQWPSMFDFWSDGGDRQHTTRIPAASATNPLITVTFSDHPLSGESIPLVWPIGSCTSDNPCGQCEGHCRSDSDCMDSLVCFNKEGRKKPVPGCVGIDISYTVWCTDTKFLEPASSTPVSPAPASLAPAMEPTVPPESSCGQFNAVCEDNTACCSGNCHRTISSSTGLCRGTGGGIAKTTSKLGRGSGGAGAQSMARR